VDNIIGIVPGGGKATRIHGFFKEMMPIGINKYDKSKFVVSSEQIVDSMIQSDANSVHFILSSIKSFIVEYYGRERIADGKINFNYDTEDIERVGMPYTIDSIYSQARMADYVMMGMPDTVIEPVETFSNVMKLLRERKADLALGLFRTDSRNKGGYIEFDEQTKKVIRHIDKTNTRSFPSSADNAWAVACWNRNFTEFMHEFLAGRKSPRSEELIFGDVIDKAIDRDDLKVVADYAGTFYWDITEPEKYFDLLRRTSPVERVQTDRVADIVAPDGQSVLAAPSARTQKDNEAKIFLSHKTADKPLVERYYAALKQLGFHPWLDEHDMPAGSNVPRWLLDGFKQSCAAVFFITENFKDEQYLATELDYAIQQKLVRGPKFSIIALRFSPNAVVPDLLAPYLYKDIHNDLVGFYELLRALPLE